MRKLIHFVHTSLDGKIEGPEGEFDWPAMGPELSAYSFGRFEHADTFLYGRPVWEVMAGYWPNAEAVSDDPHDLKFAPVWRGAPKIVFSRTLTDPGHGARVISGANLAEEVTALKSEPGKDLLLMGGAAIAGELTALGLVDEHQVVVHPVVLGGGKPLFTSSPDRLNLRLIESQTFDSRTVLLRYQRA
ncbi:MULTISPECIES: dihydrofolate reductase family protein [Streptomyces]|uniref:Dihydrofolate reductase family protein n=1 Tax=Streptomyces katrae TaxID=68223 RepID=A0ABT7GVR7_9ACTN|nr:MULTISPECIES: dihydrofolate reductase family protein [Streptomyces]MDK9497725.1 dihydrofolate reductase family protein [Streptomyces katrae]RST07334.1 dihydrofolate reductase [Streptomyces sp. WAC07149]GLX18898.1 deaminase [Streptomyces lavendulae subsp. lavendulae]GLX29180.1 deaminase [Streptomyces lavendulae subsp. lavendulae]